MGILRGKGIWTFYEDVGLAVDMAPQVGAEFILCKVSNRGRYDERTAQTALAQVHRNFDLHPVAWNYMYLDDVEAEVQCVVQALAAGYEAFVLDAEVHINLKFAQADAFTQRILALGVDTSRLYLCTDPRLDAKIDEIPMIQLARVCRGGLIPMIYGEILPNDRPNAAQRLLERSYTEYERQRAALGYQTLPLMPAISSYWDNQGKQRMNFVELKRWCDEVSARQAPFVSLFRAGVTSPEAWRAFRELEVLQPVVAGSGAGSLGISASEAVQPVKVVVAPDGPGFSEGFYPPAQPGGWTQFLDHSGNLTKYRTTSAEQTMYAAYQPALSARGRYVIETFVPGEHATTRGATYFITYHVNGERCQDQVVVDQQRYSDVWIPLGIYDLDPAFADSGVINLIDMTRDPNPREIAFSAIRWRPAPVGAGFDSPVGSLEERAGTRCWPGQWTDSNKYLNKYGLGYHTGVDLNLNWPTWNLDRHAPVYAVGDGVVIFAGEVGGAWQALVVIRHDPLPDGAPVYSRYGHVDNIMVHAGDQVVRGQQIALVGQSGGAGANYHLHFDISCTDILERDPKHWPGFDLAGVRRHYVDPLVFIQGHRPK